MVKNRAFYFSENNEKFILKTLDFVNKKLDENTIYRKTEAWKEMKKEGVCISFSAFDRIIKLITKIQARGNKMLIEMDNKITAR